MTNATKTPRKMMTKPTPACGGFPEVPAECVRIIGTEEIGGETWYRVLFKRGAILMMHPNRLAPLPC